MATQLNRFIQNIEDKLPRHDSVEAAAAEVKAELTSLGIAIEGPLKQELAAAIEVVNARLGPIVVLRRNSIIKPREQWYTGPSPSDLHWPAVRGYLKNSKGWDEETAQSIDDSSTEVVSLLANPKNTQFRCRGLVVGYVQSGKTANMTAVIAKAVDEGYNLIVLLAGMTNKLRAQTQARIEADVANRHRHQWELYTEIKLDGDFTDPANRSFTMPRQGMAQLAVMKKESNRLEAFRRTIASTPNAIRSRLRVLLIDDECDQASLNSAAREYDMTRINEQIRQIITALPAVSYVGYTATPFANVFVDPFPFNRDVLDDLYPEDFITALPRPKDYFGAREVFGDEPDDAGDDGEAGQNMIRVIEDDLDFYRPARAKDREGFEPIMGPDLRDALLWFLVTCAVRRARGQCEKHMTMLVHTSANIIPHQRTANLISHWIESHGEDLRRGVGPSHGRLLELMEKETVAVPPNTSFPKGAELKALISESLDALEVVVENSATDIEERLDYSGTPKTYIIVGGSVLARGLTLEGLTVSFFLRTSRQYDTLLQMGRWFGYRHGYDDLPRLWTTAELASNFRALAQIEDEVRDEIALYRAREDTPLDFAVRVRSIPGMAITAASKMRHAYRTSISYDGRHIQTIRFDHLDLEAITGNWKAGTQLLTEAAPHRDGDTLLFKQVPFSSVRRFLKDYRICNAHMDLKEEMLLGYLDSAEQKLAEWNVAVITASDGPPSERHLGPLGSVPTIRRAKLADTGTDYADIKALMSKRDILVDAEDQSFETHEKWDVLKTRRPSVPLMLLYPINKVSNPKRGSTTREPLDAVGDVLGFGIVFPGVRDRSGNYFAVQLDAVSQEEIELEEAADAEAAL